MRRLVALLALLMLATPAFAKGERAVGGSQSWAVLRAQGNLHIGDNLGVQIDGVTRRGNRLEVKGHLWRPGGHSLQLEGKEVRRYQMDGTSMVVQKPRLLKTLLHAQRSGDKQVKAAGLNFTATVDPKTGMIDLGRVNGQRVHIKLSGSKVESVQISAER